MSTPTTLPTGRIAYSVREVAEFLGLHYQTVLAMTHSGEIPSRYFGRHIRIPADWVHEQGATEGAR
ncbi:helix-turn-helix domain-containing protein [Pseudonocardia xishanensis]|uniref:Helix-turn-helix domain-containing protein n=1 Tax=Pseudonocardia xishanensis TaxID=630995 RepID=A0ABP8RYA4_9PSEU